MLSYRRANASDWPLIAELLTASQLPLAGAEEHIDGFLLGLEGGRMVAAAALERYGETALLRSVAVADSERGKGIGQAIVGRLLQEAHSDRITAVVLLTTTADGFFPRFGFRRVTRDQVPSAAYASVEFRGACPASSTIMLLDLRQPPVPSGNN